MAADTVTVCHAEPVHTFIAPTVVSKNNAPVTKASPSLSVDGSELFAPKYLSSKSSKLLAAEVAELADAVAELALAVAELAAAVAELAEAVAEDAEGRCDAEADVRTQVHVPTLPIVEELLSVRVRSWRWKPGTLRRIQSGSNDTATP